MKHAYSFRLFFNKGRFIDGNCKELNNSCENPQGNLVDVKVEKNKVCKPDRRLGSYTIGYAVGVDVMNDTIDIACYIEVIKQAGAWYYIIDLDTGEVLKDSAGADLKFNGKAKLIAKLKDDSIVFNELYERVNALVSGDGGDVADEISDEQTVSE